MITVETFENIENLFCNGSLEYEAAYKEAVSILLNATDDSPESIHHTPDRLTESEAALITESIYWKVKNSTWKVISEKQVDRIEHLEGQIEELDDACSRLERANQEMDNQRLVVVAFMIEYFNRYDLMLPHIEGESVLGNPFEKLNWEETVMLCSNMYDIMISITSLDGIIQEACERRD